MSPEGPVGLYARARSSIWLSWLLDNPLLVREIRRRMRGKLFSWSLIAYLAALGGVSCVIMFLQYPMRFQNLSWRDQIQQVGKIGGSIFQGMCIVEGFIALFIAPMLTAGLATAEKEKDTFDFLRVTTLHARTFVTGCLLTTACFLLLIFACTLPILGLTFIFGGVSLRDILGFNGLLFMAAMAVSAWGIFNSTNYKRSRSVHGSLIGVLFLIYFFTTSVVGSFYRRIIPSLSLAVGGTWLQGLIIASPFAAAIAVFSIAASRRLYEPNNRLFNYAQYTIFYALALAVVAGTLAFRMSAFNVILITPPQIVAMLDIFFFLGLILNVAGILIFSAGRIERGDEVWRIRQQFPIFRRVHENYLIHALYIASWLFLGYGMGAAWEGTSKFLPHFWSGLPVVLAGLFLMIALTRIVNLFVEQRNPATIGLFLTLLLLWGGAPILGYTLEAVASPGRDYPVPGLSDLADILMDASPVPVLYHIWSDDPNLDLISPPCILGGLAILLLIPTLLPWWRRRMAISYEWSLVADQPRPDPMEAIRRFREQNNK